MVQSKEQYMFVYAVVADILASRREKCLPEHGMKSRSTPYSTEVFDKLVEDWNYSESNDDTIIKCSSIHKHRPNYARVLTTVLPSTTKERQGRDIEQLTNPRKLRRARMARSGCDGDAKHRCYKKKKGDASLKVGVKGSDAEREANRNHVDEGKGEVCKIEEATIRKDET